MNARLILYVGTAVLGAVIAGATTVDFTNANQVTVFVAGVLLCGLTAAKSYYDTTAR